MHLLAREEDFNFGALFFVLLGFALADFKRDFVWLIAWNNFAISKTVDAPLRRQIIGIDKAFTDRDNAEMNSAWISFFSLARFQWCIPRSAFQLGSRPGIVSRKLGVSGEDEGELLISHFVPFSASNLAKASLSLRMAGAHLQFIFGGASFKST